MANCDKLFKEFDEAIKLSTSKKNSLRTSRNSLRDKIRSYFKDKGHDVKFHWQGSFAMNTIITPKDDDYDIDDGIYMLVEKEPEVAISTLHRWVVEAAEKHTEQKPIDKNPCVRVIFKGGYHVDLVIYYKPENDHPRLAHKRDSWIVSDPKEFMDWFNEQSDQDGQLKRIVRYFKGWKDHLEGNMPSGLIFTILATKNIVFNDRDDIAFLETMKKIRSTLKSSFTCYRPTTPYEDLFANYSKTRKNYFLDGLDSFISSGEQALEDADQDDACKKWAKHFGGRFCPLKKENQVSRNGVTVKSQYSNQFDVPHKHLPQWPVKRLGTANVTTQAARNGFRPKQIQDGNSLPKHYSLRFEVKTNIQRPYKVYWQVVNTGDEARAVNCLRGEFYNSIIEKGRRIRKESTLYKGMHWVECFIVKDGICVARSGEFVVNIE